MSDKFGVFTDIYCNGVNIEIVGKKLFQVFQQQRCHQIEREKTTEEKRVISAINDLLVPFVEIFGGKHVNITDKHVHIIDTQKTNPWESGFMINEMGECEGSYFPQLQSVFVAFLYHQDIVHFAKVITHELFHQDAYQSLNVSVKDDSKMYCEIRRTGWVMFTKSIEQKESINQYFVFLEEAIVEELVELFVNRYFYSIPELVKGMNIRSRYLRSRNKQFSCLTDFVYMSHQCADGRWHVKMIGADPYNLERKYLRELINKYDT